VKHFSEAAWTDFVRGLFSPGTREEMLNHIEGGCSKCEATVQVWQEVFSFAKQESLLNPPRDTVHMVNSQFAATTSKPAGGVRLLFDSYLQPAAAGVRGRVSARQFLFETDTHLIDLRLEPRQGLKRTSLIGQVLTRRGISRVAKDLPVRLQKSGAAIAETVTNHLGEFQLEFDADHGLSLALGQDVEQEQLIILPLYGVKPGEDASLA
jgi:hypothetical protein